MILMLLLVIVALLVAVLVAVLRLHGAVTALPKAVPRPDGRCGAGAEQLRARLAARRGP